MKILEYLLPYAAIFYGISIKLELFTPRRVGSDSGDFFIVVGILIVILVHILDFYNKNKENKEKLNVKNSFCLFIINISIIYIILYVFEILILGEYIDRFLLVLSLAVITICNYIKDKS